MEESGVTREDMLESDGCVRERFSEDGTPGCMDIVGRCICGIPCGIPCDIPIAGRCICGSGAVCGSRVGGTARGEERVGADLTR